MMPDLLTDTRTLPQMDALLCSCAAQVESEGRGRWRLGSGRRRTPIAVSAEGSWLRFAADLSLKSKVPGDLDQIELSSLLSRNATLPPLLKCGLAGDGTPWLSRDLACDDEEDVQAGVREAFSAVRAALRWLGSPRLAVRRAPRFFGSGGGFA